MTVSSPVRLVDGKGKVIEFTTSGELPITETERESDVFLHYDANLVADGYHLLISKDNPLWPHRRQGQNGTRIDLTSAYYLGKLVANAEVDIKIGVVTKIDNVNADIKYFAGIAFYSTLKTIVTDSLRGVPSQVKTDFNNAGTLSHGITNDTETTASVKTGTALPSPAGNVNPALGDIVMKVDHTAQSVAFSMFIFYHNTD